MASQKQRYEFIQTVCTHAVRHTWLDRIGMEETLKLIMRHGATHRRLQEWQASYPGWGEEQGAQETRIEKRIATLAESLGCGVIFGGDPRGCTVLLTMPDGYTNDFANRGVCVPTA